MWFQEISIPSPRSHESEKILSKSMEQACKFQGGERAQTKSSLVKVSIHVFLEPHNTYKVNVGRGLNAEILGGRLFHSFLSIYTHKIMQKTLAQAKHYIFQTIPTT